MSCSYNCLFDKLAGPLCRIDYKSMLKTNIESKKFFFCRALSLLKNFNCFQRNIRNWKYHLCRALTTNERRPFFRCGNTIFRHESKAESFDKDIAVIKNRHGIKFTASSAFWMHRCLKDNTPMICTLRTFLIFVMIILSLLLVNNEQKVKARNEAEAHTNVCHYLFWEGPILLWNVHDY